MLKLEFNTFKIICVCSSDLLCLYFCVSDINTSSSQPWETRRNCQQRRDVAQFCNSPNSKDGRWVCVCVSVCHASFSVPINNKRFAKWLNPWPAIPKIPWNLWQLVPAVPPHHHSAHTHTHTHSSSSSSSSMDHSAPSLCCPVCQTAVVSECVTLQVTPAPALRMHTLLHNAQQTPFHTALL